MERKVRIIAMYLPQYHPIPENDEWWGKGFTEWTNVGKAKPLFRGHYQPRVPADLGYYDLRLPIIREQQAEMAKNAGVEGFMYWHYWFGNGRTIMSEIFDEVLSSGKPNFPFCLGWANHSWTRRTWNNSVQYHKDEDLIIQEYPDDIESHFNAVLPAFKDKRYICVDGKPLFVIYDPESLPNPSYFLETWRSLALASGLKGVHFVGITNGWESTFQPILDMGFDAITPGHLWNAMTGVRGNRYYQMLRQFMTQHFPKYALLERYQYKDIIRHWFSSWDYKENAYPQIIPNWDRSPRGGRRATIIENSSPELFKEHVKDALKCVINKADDHKIIFLRSWNEWAEGNYVEPDLKFGHGYLDALKSAMEENL